MIEKDFEEAAESMVASYRVMRRLAGALIKEKEFLRSQLASIRILAKDSDLVRSDDLEEVLDRTPPVV